MTTTAIINIFMVGLTTVLVVGFLGGMANHPYAIVLKPFMWFVRVIYKEKDFCITLSIRRERLYAYEKGWFFWDERNYSELDFDQSFEEINNQIYRNVEALKEAHRKREVEDNKIKRLKKQGKKYLFANQVSKM